MLPQSVKSGQNSQAILNELNSYNGRVTLNDALGIPAIANISTPLMGRGISRNNQSAYNKFAMTEVMKSTSNPPHQSQQYMQQLQQEQGNKVTRNILNSKGKGTVGGNYGMTVTSFGGGSIIQDGSGYN